MTSWKELSAPEKKILIQFIVCLFLGLGIMVILSSSIEGIIGMIVLGFYMSWLNTMYFFFNIRIKNMDKEEVRK